MSLNDLSSLECALIGADATTRAVIASKDSELEALSAATSGHDPAPAGLVELLCILELIDGDPHG